MKYCLFLLLTCISANAEIPLVPFSEGLQKEIPSQMPSSPNYYVFKPLYDDYLKHGVVGDEYRIPKVIHLIFVGGPLPEKSKQFMKTWKHFHPDWTIHLWTDAEVESFNMTNKWAFDQAKNLGQKSDIWRYEILYRYGGLYIDTDFECLKAFDDLHRSCDFYASYISHNPTIANGIVGCKAGHPIMQACIDRIQLTSHNPNAYERIMEETGPYYFTKIIKELAFDLPQGSAPIFPPAFFFPFPGRHRNTLSNKAYDFVQPYSMAIHHWHCSWQK